MGGFLSMTSHCVRAWLGCSSLCLKGIGGSFKHYLVITSRVPKMMTIYEFTLFFVFFFGDV